MALKRGVERGVQAVKRREEVALSRRLMKTGRLGGYPARSKDPPPGEPVTWRGFARLTDLEPGFILRARLVGT